MRLDYGEITLDGIDKIRLYGVPGQRRFDFMWRIIEERALGFILLINNDAKDPLGELVGFIHDFAGLQERGGVVIGVTRSDVAEWPPIESYADKIREVYPHITAPVFTIDARCTEHMLLALTALLYSIESQNSVEMDLAS